MQTKVVDRELNQGKYLSSAIRVIVKSDVNTLYKGDKSEEIKQKIIEFINKYNNNYGGVVWII